MLAWLTFETLQEQRQSSTHRRDNADQHSHEPLRIRRLGYYQLPEAVFVDSSCSNQPKYIYIYVQQPCCNDREY